MQTDTNPLAPLRVRKATGWQLFVKTVLARAYPRAISDAAGRNSLPASVNSEIRETAEGLFRQ